MAAPNSIRAKGTTITIDGTSIGELTNIGEPGIAQEVADVSTLADEWSRKIATGVVSGEDVTLSGNYWYSDGGQAALRAAAHDQTLHTFIITLPDSSTEQCTFTGIVTKWGAPEAEKGGTLKFQVTIAVDGTPTWA